MKQLGVRHGNRLQLNARGTIAAVWTAGALTLSCSSGATRDAEPSGEGSPSGQPQSEQQQRGGEPTAQGVPTQADGAGGANAEPEQPDTATANSAPQGGAADGADGVQTQPGEDSGVQVDSIDGADPAPVDGGGVADIAERLMPPDGHCAEDGWCWVRPTPTGESFNLMSSDGHYAISYTTVLQWPDRYLPDFPGESPTFLDSKSGVLVAASSSSVFTLEGDNWNQIITLPTQSMMNRVTQAASGRVFVLYDWYKLVAWKDGVLEEIELPRTVHDVDLSDPAAVFPSWLDIIAAGDDLWAFDGTPYQTPKGLDPVPGVGALWRYAEGEWSVEVESHVNDMRDVRFMVSAGQPLLFDQSAYVLDVYAPLDDYRVVAHGPESQGSTSYPLLRLFVLPDGRISDTQQLPSASDPLMAYGLSEPEQVMAESCYPVVPMDDGRWICPARDGGFLRYDPKSGDVTGQPEAFWKDPSLFGSVPLKMWAGSHNFAFAQGPQDVWTELGHLDGTRWAHYQDMEGYPLDSLRSIHGSAPDNIWLLGEVSGDDTPELYAFDGQSFTQLLMPPEVPSEELTETPRHSVWTLGVDDGWLLRRAQVLVESTPVELRELWHFDGVGWSLRFSSDSASEEERAFAEGSYSVQDGQLYVAANGILHRLENGEFKPLVDYPGSLSSFLVDGEDIWLHADATLWRYAGGNFEDYGQPLLKYIGLSDDRIWSFEGAHARSRPRTVSQ